MEVTACPLFQKGVKKKLVCKWRPYGQGRAVRPIPFSQEVRVMLYV